MNTKYIYAAKSFKTERHLNPTSISYHLQIEECEWVFDYCDGCERVEVLRVDSDDDRYTAAKKNNIKYIDEITNVKLIFDNDNKYTKDHIVEKFIDEDVDDIQLLVNSSNVVIGLKYKREFTYCCKKLASNIEDYIDGNKNEEK